LFINGGGAREATTRGVNVCVFVFKRKNWLITIVNRTKVKTNLRNLIYRSD
jgi:hypothetical protein